MNETKHILFTSFRECPAHCEIDITETQHCNDQPCRCEFTSDMYTEVYGVAVPDDIISTPVGYHLDDNNNPQSPIKAVYINTTIDADKNFRVQIDDVCGHCECEEVDGEMTLTCYDEPCQGMIGARLVQLHAWYSCRVQLHEYSCRV